MLTIISLIAFDETPSVDIYHLTGPFTSEQVETAYALTESLDDIFAVCLFICRELGDESGLFPICVSADEAVNDR